jgi:hypothetical protein
MYLNIRVGYAKGCVEKGESKPKPGKNKFAVWCGS